MIQRIQSVLLFLSFLLNGAVFFTALYSQAVADPSGWIGLSFAILLTLAALIPLISIFLYGNRQRQLRWVTAGLWVQVLALGLGTGIFVSLGDFGPFLWEEGVGLILMVGALGTSLFGRKKIIDDINLVKSMDRIR